MQDVYEKIAYTWKDENIREEIKEQYLFGKRKEIWK